MEALTEALIRAIEIGDWKEAERLIDRLKEE
jgi:hypothetical protein